MHNAEQQMYFSIETWNEIIARDLDLRIIFAHEVIDIIASYWKISDESKKDSFSRKNYLRQVIETLNSILIYLPERVPSHWTEKNKEDIRYLFNNPQNIFP